MSMLDETTHLPSIHAYRSSLVVMSVAMVVATLGVITTIFLASPINIYSFLVSLVLSAIAAAYVLAEKKEIGKVDQRIAALNG